MENFTPVAGLIGGLLIGLGAGLFVLLNGRIAGISGIVGGLLARHPSDVSNRIAFIAGLLAGPGVIALAGLELPPVEIAASWPLVIIGGLLVGFGTQLGSGCTSGHGVCGLARLSPRSLVATATFMAAGFVTVFLIRHIIGA